MGRRRRRRRRRPLGHKIDERPWLSPSPARVMATTAATKASFTALGLAGGFAVSALAAPHVAAEDHCGMNHATSPTVGYGTVDVANALLAYVRRVSRAASDMRARRSPERSTTWRSRPSARSSPAPRSPCASRATPRWSTRRSWASGSRRWPRSKRRDLHKGVYQRPVPVIQWAEPRKRAMQGFVRETCVQLARRLLERAAVAFRPNFKLSQDDPKTRARPATRKCVRASWEHGDLTRAGKALSMASTYARANVIVAGGEFVVASTIMAFFSRGPLVPLQTLHRVEGVSVAASRGSPPRMTTRTTRTPATRPPPPCPGWRRRRRSFSARPKAIRRALRRPGRSGGVVLELYAHAISATRGGMRRGGRGGGGWARRRAARQGLRVVGSEVVRAHDDRRRGARGDRSARRRDARAAVGAGGGPGG